MTPTRHSARTRTRRLNSKFNSNGSQQFYNVLFELNFDGEPHLPDGTQNKPTWKEKMGIMKILNPKENLKRFFSL